MNEFQVLQFLKVLLSLSLSGTLLFLFIYVLRPLYQNRLRRSWQYYIWLLVCARFLLPFTLSASVSSSLLHASESAVSRTAGIILPVSDTSDTVSARINTDTDTQADSADKAFPGDAQADSADKAFSGDAQADSADKAFPDDTQADRCLALIQAAAVSIMLLRRILIYQRFCRLLKARNTAVTDTETLHLLAECMEKLQIRRHIQLCQSTLAGSPMTVGCLHPCIILPAEPIRRENLSYIFMHELIHLKRQDLLYKWLVQIVVCIHWLNPFVRLLAKETNRACELSCDEAVLGLLENEKDRRSYGNMLLSFVKAGSVSPKYHAPVMLTEGAEQLKERLGAIMDYKKKTKKAAAAAALLTALVCFLFTALGAYTQPPQSTQSADQTFQTKPGISSQNDPSDASGISLTNYSDIKSGQNKYGHYTQQFYQDSYLIELTWNIEDPSSYAESAVVTLTDQTDMTVYFHKNAAKYAGNKKALAAAGTVIASLQKTETAENYQILYPAILRMVYIPAAKVPDYVEKYFVKRDYSGFSALFPALDHTLQPGYAPRAYKASDIAFFDIILDALDDTAIRKYAEKSVQDGRVDFLSVLLEQSSPQAADLDQYAGIAYTQNDIACFSTLADSFSKSAIRKYAEKSVQDGRVDFLSVLLEQSSPQAADLDRYAGIAYMQDDIACYDILTSYMSDEQKRTWKQQAKKDRNDLFYYAITD